MPKHRAVPAMLASTLMGRAPVMRAQSQHAAGQFAAGAKPKFEVASIKPAEGRGHLNSVELGFQRGAARASRGGTFHVPSAPLHLLIQLAYDAKDYQIVGEPAWANSDGYDITAKAAGN